MKLIILSLFSIIFAFLINVNVINCAPISEPQKDNNNLDIFKIPQWHCLRYIKHDYHLMRRCRNHRLPLTRPRI